MIVGQVANLPIVGQVANLPFSQADYQSAPHFDSQADYQSAPHFDFQADYQSAPQFDGMDSPGKPRKKVKSSVDILRPDPLSVGL
jgi:hypothetical protein